MVLQLNYRGASEKHKKPYEWFVKNKEAHGFYKDENQTEYLNAVLKFLEQHIQK